MFNRQRRKKRHPLRQWLPPFILWVSLVLIVGMSLTLYPAGSVAQLPSFNPQGTVQPLPPGVERRGTLESAPVRLDGQELFRIASPTVLNRSEPGTQIPVEVRAREIEANLEQVIADRGETEETTIDPKSLQVLIQTMNGFPVLFAKDANSTEAQVLLTVTNTDAQFHSTSTPTLATRWQGILERELRQAIELRLPAAFRRQVQIVITASIVTLLSTLVLGSIWGFLGRRKQILEQRQLTEAESLRAQTTAIAGVLEPASDSQHLGSVPQRLIGVQRRLQLIRFLRWLLFWAIAFIWVSGVAYSLGTFPQTRQFARRVVAIPVVLLLTWFITGLTNRVTDLLTDRFIQSRELKDSLTEANLQRIATIANVIKGLKMVLFYTIGALLALQWLNLVPGSILTLGALLALVLSFAAQNLVKDLVNGFLILLEDQFRIGDMIKIGTTSGLSEIIGLVENLNLRITQLRSPSGNLITVPNSSIAQVENMSRSWARADFQIEVSYNTDVDLALRVVRKTLDQLAQDPPWKSKILDTQEVFGVEQLTHTGIVIRVWIKTAPLKQWDVARELRRRLKIAFDQHHIQIGTPQQIWMDKNWSQSNPVGDEQLTKDEST